jgi:hypothetical protein
MSPLLFDMSLHNVSRFIVRLTFLSFCLFGFSSVAFADFDLSPLKPLDPQAYIVANNTLTYSSDLCDYTSDLVGLTDWSGSFVRYVDSGEISVYGGSTAGCAQLAGDTIELDVSLSESTCGFGSVSGNSNTAAMYCAIWGEGYPNPTVGYYVHIGVDSGAYYDVNAVTYSPVDGVNISAVTQTRFTDLTYSSSSLTATYFLDTNEINTSISEFNPTLVSFKFVPRTGTNETVFSESINNSVNGTSSVTTDFSTLSDGVYDLQVYFSNSGVLFGAPQPFPKSYIYTEFTVSSGTISSIGTLELYSPQYFADTTISESECGLTKLDGCLKNFAVWLFYPSDTGMQILADTQESLKSKVPFNYVFGVSDTVQMLSSQDGELPALSVEFGQLGEVTLLDSANFEVEPWSSLFATVRLILQAVIFLTLVFVLYRRTRSYVAALVGMHVAYEVGRGKK